MAHIVKPSHPRHHQGATNVIFSKPPPAWWTTCQEDVLGKGKRCPEEEGQCYHRRVPRTTLLELPVRGRRHQDQAWRQMCHRGLAEWSTSAHKGRTPPPHHGSVGHLSGWPEDKQQSPPQTSTYGGRGCRADMVAGGGGRCKLAAAGQVEGKEGGRELFL